MTFLPARGGSRAVLTLFLTGLCFAPLPAQGPRMRGSTVPAGSQAGWEQYLQTTDSQITQIMQDDARLPRKPITFSANLTLAYGTLIKQVPTNVLLAAADALKEAGVERIDMNPSVTDVRDPEAEAKYDALIRHIRSLGLKVALNPEYEQPKRHGVTFAQFQKNALERYAEWAARYKPDEFVVVHEPTTMNNRMHLEASPEQWRGFVVATAKVVKQASPHSRVGAGAFAGISEHDVPYFEEFARIPEVEVLTVDNYVGRADAMRRMDHMVQVARDARKPVYMEETWRPHYMPAHLHHQQGASMESEAVIGFGYSGFEPVDVKWLRAMALYAATHGMETMTPFQSRCFFRYVDTAPFDGPGYDKRVEQAILEKNRTQTFAAFQQYIKEYGR